MKITGNWLREWVSPPLDNEELAHRLTMIGHEVDQVIDHAKDLAGVVIGEVISVSAHPDADRLSVCTVSTGTGQPLDVVCGAPNVRAGMKSAFAPVGTLLPGGTRLRRTRIRGIESNGMLCSASELGLGDDADGIIALADNAEPGRDLCDYLALPDVTFDIDLTPNRGDCFSVLGIAREVAALASVPLGGPAIESVPAMSDIEHPVELPYPEGCPRFVARVVSGIDMSAKSPDWMKERLRRCGLRAIHPVVDVTNYVMLELGQPLHAYDLELLQGTVHPRLAKDGEELTLLDEKRIELDNMTLVIADGRGPIGMAGIMGGLSTAVTEKTQSIFFEAAFFSPQAMSGVARRYGMHTDASMRFERGVDPVNQVRAIERATRLLLQIAGGIAGPLVNHAVEEFLPESRDLELRRVRLRAVLGTDVPDDRVGEILGELGLSPSVAGTGWTVRVPTHRFDLEQEDDLVEEVARIYGYDRIPEVTGNGGMPLALAPESKVSLESVADLLVARDFQEVITYSFVDHALDKLISGADSELVLNNPISSEMAVMRSSVWPGLLAAASANASRQQDRIRLFEIGKTFHGSAASPVETLRIAGLVGGTAYAEQWAEPSRQIDFFDIKGDVEAILQATGQRQEFGFAAAEHRALQPGQTAEVRRRDRTVGILGRLHPAIGKDLDLPPSVYVFELDAAACLATAVPEARPVSRFPAIRRDVAIVVPDEVRAADLVAAVRTSAPELVKSVNLFDVYRGKGIEAGRKSVALGLILQETSRTLTDDDADAVMSAVLRKLQQEFGAELRD